MAGNAAETIVTLHQCTNDLASAADEQAVIDITLNALSNLLGKTDAYNPRISYFEYLPHENAFEHHTSLPLAGYQVNLQCDVSPPMRSMAVNERLAGRLLVDVTGEVKAQTHRADATAYLLLSQIESFSKIRGLLYITADDLETRFAESDQLAMEAVATQTALNLDRLAGKDNLDRLRNFCAASLEAAILKHDLIGAINKSRLALELIFSHAVVASGSATLDDIKDVDQTELHTALNTLLDVWKKVHVQQFNLRNNRAALPEALSQIVSKRREKYPTIDIDLRTSAASSELLINALLVEGAFSKVFDNALRHAATRVIIDTKTVEIHGELWCQLTIQDDGKGIEESQKKRIFREIIASSNGSGEGLLITWTSLWEQYGCPILASSNENGTRFDLFFPCDSSEGRDEPQA